MGSQEVVHIGTGILMQLTHAQINASNMVFKIPTFRNKCRCATGHNGNVYRNDPAIASKMSGSGTVINV